MLSFLQLLDGVAKGILNYRTENFRKFAIQVMLIGPAKSQNDINSVFSRDNSSEKVVSAIEVSLFLKTLAYAYVNVSQLYLKPKLAEISEITSKLINSQSNQLSLLWQVSISSQKVIQSICLQKKREFQS